jgi:1,4-dihydroxy-6-naphthoate synthase
MTAPGNPQQALSLGFSPCPNDTFIFYALTHRRVDWGPLVLNPFLADVELLNQRARQHTLDITKVSINAVAHLLDEYWLLRTGGALGRGCGPVVVARTACSLADLRDQPLAIPGRLTTAHLLLQLHGEHRGDRVEMSFDRIMPAIVSGEVAAGVVIHEGRFTYADLGLHLVLDLGSWWEQHTGLPLPLGGIVMKRALGADAAKRMEHMIRASLRYAYEHRDEARDYIAEHAQEMEPAIIRQHIDTFVNEYTMDLGTEGQQAIRYLVEAARREAGMAPVGSSVFWTDEAP